MKIFSVFFCLFLQKNFLSGGTLQRFCIFFNGKERYLTVEDMLQAERPVPVWRCTRPAPDYGMGIQWGILCIGQVMREIVL